MLLKCINDSTFLVEFLYNIMFADLLFSCTHKFDDVMFHWNELTIMIIKFVVSESIHVYMKEKRQVNQ